MFASAFCLAYFAILRMRKIKQTNRSHNNALTVHNTLFSGYSIKLILAKTITNQNGAGTTLIITLSDDNHLLFNNLQSYLNARPKYPGQLLCHIDALPSNLLPIQPSSQNSLGISQHRHFSFKIPLI